MNTVSTKTNHVAKILLSIFLGTISVFLFISISSYSPFDPSWTYIASDTQKVANIAGVTGAWFADIFRAFLGWSSLLIPFLGFYEIWQLWKPHHNLTRPWRFLAQALIVVMLSVILSLIYHGSDTSLSHAGGIIGYEIAQGLAKILTVYGAIAFLMFFLVLACTLAFALDWKHILLNLRNSVYILQDTFYFKRDDENLALATHSAHSFSPYSTPTITKTSTTETPYPIFDDMEPPVSPTTTVTAGTQQELFDSPITETTVDQTPSPAKQQPDTVNISAANVYVSGNVWHQDHDKTEKYLKEIQSLLEQSKIASPMPNIITPKAEESVTPQVEETTPINPLPTSSLTNSIIKESENSLLSSTIPPTNTFSTLPTPEKIDTITLEKHSPLQEDKQSILQTEPNVEREHLPLVDHHSYQDQHMITPDQPVVSNDPLQELTLMLQQLKQQLPEEVLTSKTDITMGNVHSLPESDHLHSEVENVCSSIAEVLSTPMDTTLNSYTPSSITEIPPIPQSEELDQPVTNTSSHIIRSRAMQTTEYRRQLSPVPSLDLLDRVDPNQKVSFTTEQLDHLSELLQLKLQDFNIKAVVKEVQPGPVVTRFALELAPGVKASKVTNISRDLARSMSMTSVRVVEVIPGKPYIGIEVPNKEREIVRLIELLDIPEYRDSTSFATMAMGKDIAGKPVLTDLTKTPHMLVAGTTGSGKSVAVNAMLLSMLLKYTPDQLRLILIDPKQLELANYDEIPHLLTPVVTDMKDALSALNWCVGEMERRYKLMSFFKVRKISEYNRKVNEAMEQGEDLIDPTWKPSDSATQERAPRLQPLPTIVIVADEFADMIMQVGKKAEELITRLAQKARASGIHLLLATQRPSVDVITGLIKANIPTRVALRVNSKIDSRTILDSGGAEDLLGHGDMLFLAPGKIEPERVHGAYISDDEVNRICDAWRERGSANYVAEILECHDDQDKNSASFDEDSASNEDVLYTKAVEFVLKKRKVTISLLQREFSIGYQRAARLVDSMERNGIISEPQGSNNHRDILV